MKFNSRNIILGSAALALVAFQAPALASGDRDTGFGLNSGYAVENVTESYGFQPAGNDGIVHAGTHGFTATDRANGYGISTSRADAPDFNTTRDWR